MRLGWDVAAHDDHFGWGLYCHRLRFTGEPIFPKTNPSFLLDNILQFRRLLKLWKSCVHEKTWCVCANDEFMYFGKVKALDIQIMNWFQFYHLLEKCMPSICENKFLLTMHCYFAIGWASPSSCIGKLAVIQPIFSSVLRWSDRQETWRSFRNSICFLRYWSCTCAVWDLTYPVHKPCNVRSWVTLCRACHRNILAFNNRFVLWRFLYHWICCMKQEVFEMRMNRATPLNVTVKSTWGRAIEELCFCQDQPKKLNKSAGGGRAQQASCDKCRHRNCPEVSDATIASISKKVNICRSWGQRSVDAITGLHRPLKKHSLRSEFTQELHRWISKLTARHLPIFHQEIFWSPW